jgi:acyl-CoA synthetase (AMP-forming)/AMP-acid ligase II
MLTVGDLMRRASVSYADRIAVISGTRQIGFAEAWERGLRVANALIGLGLSPGDRVAVLEEPQWEPARWLHDAPFAKSEAMAMRAFKSWARQFYVAVDEGALP